MDNTAEPSNYDGVEKKEPTVQVPVKEFVHNRQEIFDTLINRVAKETDTPPQAISAEYWLGHTLSSVQNRFHVLFKGGTSLRHLRIIERYSQDVDLHLRARVQYCCAGMDLVDHSLNDASKPLDSTMTERQRYYGVIYDNINVPDMSKTRQDTAASDPKMCNMQLRLKSSAYPDEILLEVTLEKHLYPLHPMWNSELHDIMEREHPGRFLHNIPTGLEVAHPMETLAEKLHAIYKRFNKNKLPVTFARHYADAYSIITKRAKFPIDISFPALLEKKRQTHGEEAFGHITADAACFSTAAVAKCSTGYAAIAAFFWGEIVDLSVCCATIRTFLQSNLNK